MSLNAVALGDLQDLFDVLTGDYTATFKIVGIFQADELDIATLKSLL